MVRKDDSDQLAECHGQVPATADGKEHPLKLRRRKKIKVSVIMPARNAEKYIEEAVRSVLEQRGVAYELLIADDASTDGTWRRLGLYRRRPHVRIWRFRNSKRGPGAVRNYLARHAKGAYLAFCDADDKLMPGFLCQTAKRLAKDRKIGAVYTDRWVKERSGQLRRFSRNAGPADTWDLLGGPLSNPGLVVRRTLFLKLGGYRKEIPYMEDCEFFWRLGEVTRFAHLTKPLYWYRRHRNSLTERYKRKARSARKALLREVIMRRHKLRISW